MSNLLRAIVLLEVCFACFTITDVSLVSTEGSLGERSTAGLRYTGDIYNPPAAGCNRIPCGLGTNNQPETQRLAINVEDGYKIAITLRIENTSYTGRIQSEFRYGENPQFAIGTRGFPLGQVVPIVKDADQVAPALTFVIAPSYTANATIQVYFTVADTSGNGRNSTVFYQCVDITVKGKSPLPPWAADFGPKEQGVFLVDPGRSRGYDCALDPRCVPYAPNVSDWAWLIILCVLSCLVLCLCFCIAFFCCRKQPKTVVSPPPEPPPPHEDVVVQKELTPSTSKVSPYAHFAFTDPNDPPSKKGTDSGSIGDRAGTGSQGRHFHFHYEEAEPLEAQRDPEVVVR